MIDELEEFLANANVRNKWICFDGGEAYLRKSSRIFGGCVVSVLDLASIKSESEGDGRVGKFLDRISAVAKERFAGCFVESIMNPRLQGMLNRRGYTVWRESYEEEDLPQTNMVLFRENWKEMGKVPSRIVRA